MAGRSTTRPPIRKARIVVIIDVMTPPLVRREPAAHARPGLPVGGRIRRLGRRRGRGGGAHEASGRRPEHRPAEGLAARAGGELGRRSGPRRSRGSGPTATGPPRARARPAGSRGPRRARSRSAAGARTRWRRRRGPRVGCEATSTAGSRDDLAGDDDLLLVAARERPRRASSAPPPRTSNSSSRGAGASLDAPREHPAVRGPRAACRSRAARCSRRGRSRAPGRGAGGRSGCGPRPASSTAWGLAPVMSRPSAAIVPGGRRAQAGDRVDQLGLAVAVDAGEPDDLAGRAPGATRPRTASSPRSSWTTRSCDHEARLRRASPGPCRPRGRRRGRP